MPGVLCVDRKVSGTLEKSSVRNIHRFESGAVFGRIGVHLGLLCQRPVPSPSFAIRTVSVTWRWLPVSCRLLK